MSVGRSGGRLAVALACGLAGAASLLACSSFSPFGEGITDPDGGDGGDGASIIALDATGAGEATTPDDAATSADAASPGALMVFVTSFGFNDVTNTTAADAKCKVEAAGRLPGRFVAWYSAPGRPAATRLIGADGGLVDGPWFRKDGQRVAANRAALSRAAQKSLDNPISLTATGAPTGSGVWTGTFADGGVGGGCPGATPTSGQASAVDKEWTDQEVFTARCTDSLALYCFQVE